MVAEDLLGDGGDVGAAAFLDPLLHLVQLQEPDGRHHAHQVDEHAGAEPGVTEQVGVREAEREEVGGRGSER